MPVGRQQSDPGRSRGILWPDHIIKSLERAMKRMPPIIRGMALSRLREDVESHLSTVGRLNVEVNDVLLISRQMVSGRMYESLERELTNGKSPGASGDKAPPTPPRAM